MTTASEPVTRWSEWHEVAAVVTSRRHLKRTVTVALTVGITATRSREATISRDRPPASRKS
jgi:hypothetical protein